MPPKRKASRAAGEQDKFQNGDETESATSKPVWQLKPQKPDPKSFQVAQPGKKDIPCLRYYPFSDHPAMIFTHGAGGTLSAAAMVNFGAGFNETKPLVYFQGPMNLKIRADMFKAVAKHEGWSEAFGGRSMGARAAVLAAQDDKQTRAIVLASYPLKNDKGEVRDQILLDLRKEVDVLFMSGDKDEMCNIDELAAVRGKMKARSWMIVVRGADHGMNVKPKKATDELGKLTGRLAARWLDQRDHSKTECEIGWDVGKGSAFEKPWSTTAEETESTDNENEEIEEDKPKKKRKVKH